MNVLNHADSYARFSVDDRQGLIYGAIYTPTRTLEISPAATPSQQDVHIFEREQSYETQVGEQRVVSLADGSMIYVNTDSQVDVRYTKRRAT